ncbi:MAG: uncharacterized protein PWQ25_1020 [Deferribacteres bacterium]|jgi:hypothetical protein|nr:hypothetical protein [Deferribacteraceae bacterium]MDK2792157.1 uncharacterized protein [Deferribacteres bacterium]
MERLNQSFGIGIIELYANPYKSKILYPASYKKLDFKTIDKLCNINRDFNEFMLHVEKILSAEDKFLSAVKKEFEEKCDRSFTTDEDINKYCKEKHIPIDDNSNDLS